MKVKAGYVGIVNVRSLGVGHLQQISLVKGSIWKDKLGIKTVDHRCPCGDLMKGIPGRECKGPRGGATWWGLKDRRKAELLNHGE